MAKDIFLYAKTDKEAKKLIINILGKIRYYHTGTESIASSRRDIDNWIHAWTPTPKQRTSYAFKPGFFGTSSKRHPLETYYFGLKNGMLYHMNYDDVKF